MAGQGAVLLRWRDGCLVDDDGTEYVPRSALAADRARIAAEIRRVWALYIETGHLQEIRDDLLRVVNG